MTSSTAAGASSGAAPDQQALRVRDLWVTFGRGAPAVPVVRGVDLDVARGELVALLGESGSGKSVTARSLVGLAGVGSTRTAAELTIAGTDVLALDEDGERRLRGQRVGLVLQDALSALNPVLSVGDQLGELFRVHQGASRRRARAAAVDALGAVGIPDPARRVDEHPHQFSGGMRQRLLMAMAVALEPQLLIADEPTTALDVTVQAQVLDLIDRLRRELSMGVLLITHDLGVVAEVADRVSVMYAGRLAEAGRADDTLTTPAHPYTQALLRSVPRAAGRGHPLTTIPGAPPSPRATPPGCAFHPRCHVALPVCAEVLPAAQLIAADRVSTCHRTREVLHELVG